MQPPPLHSNDGAERGFGLVEVLIAVAGIVLITTALVALIRQTSNGVQHEMAYRQAYAAASDLIEKWSAEATTSFAIFIPTNDVQGGANGDGHEVDFYARDGKHHGSFWAYRFADGALQRYTYAAPSTSGGAPSGLATSGPALSGISAFAATYVPASTLAGTPWLNGYVPKDYLVNFGYPGVDGGNRIVALHVANATIGFDRTIHLLPGTMPTGFTLIVGTYTPTPVCANGWTLSGGACTMQESNCNYTNGIVSDTTGSGGIEYIVYNTQPSNCTPTATTPPATGPTSAATGVVPTPTTLSTGFACDPVAGNCSSPLPSPSSTAPAPMYEVQCVSFPGYNGIGQICETNGGAPNTSNGGAGDNYNSTWNGLVSYDGGATWSACAQFITFGGTEIPNTFLLSDTCQPPGTDPWANLPHAGPSGPIPGSTPAIGNNQISVQSLRRRLP